MPDLDIIHVASERKFAEAFFDHGEWEYHPGPFYLTNGVRYTPDFYDGKRMIFIEVIGSPGAYYRNRCKYDMFAKEHPDKPLEFRMSDGKEASIHGGSLCFPSSPQHPRHREGYCHPKPSRQWDLRYLLDDLRHFFIATRWRFVDFGSAINLDPNKISLVLRAMNPYCTKEYYDSVKGVLDDFKNNPTSYQPRTEKWCVPEQLALYVRDYPGCSKFVFGKPFPSPYPPENMQ